MQFAGKIKAPAALSTIGPLSPRRIDDVPFHCALRRQTETPGDSENIPDIAPASGGCTPPR